MRRAGNVAPLLLLALLALSSSSARARSVSSFRPGLDVPAVKPKQPAAATSADPEWYRALYALACPLPVQALARIGGGWGAPRAGGKRRHEGIDLAAATGTPVLAMQEGEVYRVQPRNVGAGGLYVGVRHAGGFVSRYMHLSRIADGIVVGARVRQGDVVGYVGSTGTQSTGPHLHADLRVPRSLLPELDARGLRPRSGWGTHQAGQGTAIPAEPWVPVGGVRRDTRERCMAEGIPLRIDRA